MLVVEGAWTNGFDDAHPLADPDRGGSAAVAASLLRERQGISPHALKTVEVAASHVATSTPSQAEDGRMCDWNPIRVLVDEHLIVRTIDRVVQHGSV